MILLSRKLSCCMGFSVKQDHFLCFSSAKCSVPHHVITNSGSRQQTAEVKVQASIDTVHSQVPLESAEISSKLMVEPSRQLKFQEPSSSRHEGWNSFAQTQTSIISSGAVKEPFLASWRHFRKAHVLPRAYLPSLADVSDSSSCLDMLLDNLLHMAVLEQSD